MDPDYENIHDDEALLDEERRGIFHFFILFVYHFKKIEKCKDGFTFPSNKR
jgi:hypothetical protein